MNYLLAGHESKERIELLLQLTKINSDSVRDSITVHLINGFSESDAASIKCVSLSNFNRALARLNEVAGIVEQIKEIDLHHLKSVK
jgi:hypothetical protein